MRDKRKELSYFQDQLEKANSFVDYFYKKILEAGQSGNSKKRLLPFIDSFVNRFLLEYSMGESPEDYTSQSSQLMDILKLVSPSKSQHAYLTSLLCILVLTDQSDEYIETCLNSFKKIELDHEIFYLLAGKSGFDLVKNQYPYEYWKFAYQSVKEEDPAQLYLFLDAWYEKHSGVSWYNSHLDGSGVTYTGYWCLEAAAIAKTHKLWDDKILNHPHFPKDLII